MYCFAIENENTVLVANARAQDVTAAAAAAATAAALKKAAAVSYTSALTKKTEKRIAYEST